MNAPRTPSKALVECDSNDARAGARIKSPKTRRPNSKPEDALLARGDAPARAAPRSPSAPRRNFGDVRPPVAAGAPSRGRAETRRRRGDRDPLGAVRAGR